MVGEPLSVNIRIKGLGKLVTELSVMRSSDIVYEATVFIE